MKSRSPKHYFGTIVLTSGGTPPPPAVPKGFTVVGIRYDPGNSFDIVTGGQPVHTYFLGCSASSLTKLDQVRAANPEMRMLCYVSPFRSNIGPGPWVGTVTGTGANNLLDLTVARNHDAATPSDSWLLYNSASKIQANELWAGNINTGSRLINVGRASLRTYVLARMQDILDAFPQFDGFFFDEINSSYIYYLVSNPVVDINNPVERTSPEYPTEGQGSAWQDATVGFFQYISNTIRDIRGKYIVANAGQQGTFFSSPTQQGGPAQYLPRLAPYVDGFNMEWYVQSPSIAPGQPDGDQNPYPMFNTGGTHWTEWWNEWAYGIDFIQNLGCHAYAGNKISRFTLAGVYNGVPYIAGSLTNDRNVMIYSRASFFLYWNGVDGGNWFWFDTASSTLPYDSRYTTYIGQPKSVPLGKTPNVAPNGYMRYYDGRPDYGGAVVAVNPSKVSQTFNFDSSYTSLDTGAVVSSITLLPKRGFIGTKP